MAETTDRSPGVVMGALCGGPGNQVMDPDRRIRATFLVDLLDAVIADLPPGCQPLDPAVCGHPEDAHKRYRDGRLICLDCGTDLKE